MIPATGFRRLIAPFSALVLMSGVHAASAQEISASHLEAARAAISSINATEQFDEILPSAARALKGELIQKDPNLEALITKTVDDKALALAARRADLETESARAYANAFSEDELKAIAAFYTSDAGKKLLAEGPIVTREVVKAANIWQNGIARDLATSVAEVLAAQAGATAAPAPEQPAQQ
ncbi:DUF2059 domain-containing protein [Brucella pituitosa]|jgi:uncharacterized protein|uniref:DUF2059 domain-containing protein n=2 Tax=Brucella TaxID=234 RepID=A0A256FMK0_9HYPH|nr:MULTISPECIES: DUF2059 domain-containing protein [Brucella]PQZ51952.1 DUF2059 domain-containing protein [Ochrobactrum sp. MYb19]PRA56565.1 DUF2059 domain-containing protein [Ochrobactrum sp. MYb68]PRA62642.1 DUF2059 domain-containing protein [Ochrobactrum sp. MYb18]PRA76704.1 DUF2059 domain-containing protein [Brucella thiophenivorans]PRA87255.1 DUF2059 domain-containing protein [Ochrobactrum sp. MYb29]PRA93663.1 DUF2059 domain-containing protein [Ochrobactrum sp. MYb14]PRA98711.1 DUF2059 